MQHDAPTERLTDEELSMYVQCEGAHAGGGSVAAGGELRALKAGLRLHARWAVAELTSRAVGWLSLALCT